MRYRIIKGYFIKEILELIRTKMILMPFFIPFLNLNIQNILIQQYQI